MKFMSLVFVVAFVHACLNSSRHLVAYEVDSRIFITILVCALST